MKVLKFGGTSVGSVQSIEKLIGIVRQSGERIIVVSAFSGVTDMLIKAVNQAASSGDFWDTLESLKTRHLESARSLITAASNHQENLAEVEQHVITKMGEIEKLLTGISLLHEKTARTLDLAMSYGERLSAYIIAKAFAVRGMPAEFVDAREIIRTDDQFGSAHYFEQESRELIRARLLNNTFISVVTGFIGATDTGITTTLGRGGSDLTAGILGAALDAEEIQIWTDVDGILTADPRLVRDAFVINEISYAEALEMSHFGAKVLHPPTILPAMVRGIPIRIKNTFNADAPGTLIAKKAASSGYPVRGLASIADIALIRVQGPGMPGVTGIAARMFGALAGAQVNVILITQASSELSICCAINPLDGQKAVKAISGEFELEIKAGLIQKPSIEEDLSVVAVVGERMKRKTGIAGRVFSALGRNGINVVAIAQGSSELNISIVVARRDRGKALQTIHDAFFLAGIRTVNLFLVGTGLIGSTLLAQIARQKADLRQKHSIAINVAGICNSRYMLLKEDGIGLEDWRDGVASAEKANLDAFIDGMIAMNLPSACFCDCTASDEPGKRYEKILKSSIAVVTPNKRANAGEKSTYNRLINISREKGNIYRYETTVGAGLPVIGPLQDLVASGDTIHRIEAVLSGTISFLFNTLEEGRKFSEIIKEAKAKGYTEPDPRDDLSALDAARKTLILIREAGFNLDFKDIRIEPLLPQSCLAAQTIEEFLEILPSVDEAYEAKRREAAEHGNVLRYVSEITPAKASIMLKEFGPRSPFFNLAGTDNMVVFTTDRYTENPLIVRGPGAGADVTAGGVFADILKLAE